MVCTASYGIRCTRATCVVDVGYVLANPSGRNLSLACLATGFQLLRIREEELLLTGDDSYRSYCREVRYRIVPGVF